MEIAGFSPSGLRTPGMSMLLAPVQALVAFFMPDQSAQVQRRAAVYSPMLRASNQKITAQHAPNPVSARPIACLKVVREFDPYNKRSHAGRMVISGRMADVCAELDRIALKESA